jgi:hypothetical protein
MIFDELFNLRQFLVNRLKINVRIGNANISNTEYPIVQILANEEMTAHNMNEMLVTLDMPVNLKIIVDEKNEVKAFEMLDKMLREVNQFSKEKGHNLEGTITPEYVDEKKTYEINVSYNLKLLQHDQN